MEIIKRIFFWSFLPKKLRSERSKRFKLTLGVLKILVIFPVFYLVSGCNFYKVTTSAYPQSGEIASLVGNKRSFVIHSGPEVFMADIIQVKTDSIQTNYIAEYTMPFEQDSFPAANSTNRYRASKGDSRLVNEVHIYLQSPCSIQDNIRSFALNDIYRMDIYDPNFGQTFLSWFVGCTIGSIIGFPVLVLLTILFLMVTGNSCPYIYTYNGNDFNFAGEIYSGAVYAPLERDDYLELPRLVAAKGRYMLKISNELAEVQHTNLMELIVIDHPENSEVLVDKYGQYQTAVDVISPSKATNIEGTDILPLLENKDTLFYYGTDPQNEFPLTDEIILTFNHPKNTSTGKLFIKVRNSLWLDNVYRNFHSLLGSYHDKWIEKQNKADGEKMKEWLLSQKIPLLIYVEKNGDWVFTDYYNMAGPMAFKEDVIAIDLKDIDSGPVKIKLETGMYFWEIDYVGLDYSSNIPVDLNRILIDMAITEKKDTVTDLLKYDDLKYYIQPEATNIADLSFSAPIQTSPARTVILHSKGFYQINQELKGFPKIRKLNKIRKKGEFLEYSRELLKSEMERLYQK